MRFKRTEIIIAVILLLLSSVFFFIMNLYRYANPERIIELHEMHSQFFSLQLETERLASRLTAYGNVRTDVNREELIHTLVRVQKKMVLVESVNPARLGIDEYPGNSSSLDELYSLFDEILSMGNGFSPGDLDHMMAVTERALIVEDEVSRGIERREKEYIVGNFTALRRRSMAAESSILLSLVLLSALALQSSRKRLLNRELVKSERKFQLIFDEAYHYIKILDREGLIRNVNKKALELAGLTLEDVIGQPLWDTAWWNHSEETKSLLKDSLGKAATGETILFEAVHMDSGNRLIIVDISVKPIYGEGGRVDQIIVEGKDITQRKKTEDRIRQLRNFLRDIINSMPSLLIVVDESLRITMVNRSVLSALDGTPEDMAGRDMEQIYPFLGKSVDKIRETMYAGEPQIMKKQKLMVDGKWEFHDIAIYPLRGEGYGGAVIRIDNVTDIQHLEELMIQSEKMLSVGGLAAGMAHEINNPLAGMIQTAEVLYDRLGSLNISPNQRAAEKYGISIEALREYMEDRKILSMLESIRKAGSRASEIVENMLSFVKREGASVSSQNMEKLLDRSLELAATDYDLKKRFGFMDVEIIRDIGDNLPFVPCESSKIQQVILSIIKNGAEAIYDYRMEERRRGENPEKSRMIFRLKYDGTDKMFIMEIEDNGPGMEDGIRKRVFEPFYTTKTVGKGTGLGLSVSYFIINESHRGALSVESEVGKGSKFIIKLPVATAHFKTGESR